MEDENYKTEETTRIKKGNGWDVYFAAKRKLHNMLERIKRLVIEEEEVFDVIDKFQSEIDYVAPELIFEHWSKTAEMLKQAVPIEHPLRGQMVRIWDSSKWPIVKLD